MDIGHFSSNTIPTWRRCPSLNFWRVASANAEQFIDVFQLLTWHFQLYAKLGRTRSWTLRSGLMTDLFERFRTVSSGSRSN